MTKNTHKEVRRRKHRAPLRVLEHTVPVAIPFLEKEKRCEACGTASAPEESEDTGRCPNCESSDIVDDRAGALEFISEMNGHAVRLVLRTSEAIVFFKALDRTLRASFGVRLAAVEDCEPGIRQVIGVCGP